MSSEAAVLGVPAVFIATTGRGYTDDEERRYGLVKYLPETSFEEALVFIDDMLRSGTSRQQGARARQRLLADKIDVTQWMIDYFEERFEARAAPGRRS
jgi:predicted glycosyltransferase